MRFGFQHYHMRLLFYSLILAIALSACNWINPSEEIPSYVRIDSISFSATGTQGTASQSIVDAWVYIDGENAGVYELPCTFPVLKTGNCRIQVFPGIKLDGISATRAIYPFMKSWEGNFDLLENSITIISPAVTYAGNLEFEVIEDFESGGITFSETVYSDTILMRSSDPGEVFEGGYSGKIVVDTDHPLADVKSNDAFLLPQGGAYNFLELNFKTDVAVGVGVIANDGTQSVYHPVVGLNPTTTWKKIYINLSPVVSRETSSYSFYVFFRINLPDDMSVATFSVDNIKLIHVQ